MEITERQSSPGLQTQREAVMHPWRKDHLSFWIHAEIDIFNSMGQKVRSRSGVCLLWCTTGNPVGAWPVSISGNTLQP